jgi:hypothetical protein
MMSGTKTEKGIEYHGGRNGVHSGAPDISDSRLQRGREVEQRV